MLLILTANMALADARHAPPVATATAVDVAILLDTSNSMDGLIRQAKSQLWTIVQQFALAEKNACTPRLRVALLEYGNTNLPASEGYIRQVVPLTGDLDELSAALFSLTTNGGDEYCGQVIDEAISRLDWSRVPGSYQAIFIAGNEPFTQGSVDFRQVCERAVARKIVINTIHCGRYDDGVQGSWQRGADLGRGDFFNIDQDRAVVHIPCPQDDYIIRLNSQLNKTYLWYGSAKDRDYFCENQQAQDSNARVLSPSVAISRSMVKSSKVYNNSNRDLVDACAENENFLETVSKEDLPDTMQVMTPAERTTYLHEMAASRTELKRKIGEQAAAREVYLAAEKKKLATESGEATLGDAVVSAIRKQLLAEGYVFVDVGGEIGRASCRERV